MRGTVPICDRSTANSFTTTIPISTAPQNHGKRWPWRADQSSAARAITVQKIDSEDWVSVDSIIGVNS